MSERDSDPRFPASKQKSLLERLRDGAKVSATASRRHGGDIGEMFYAMSDILNEAAKEIERLLVRSAVETSSQPVVSLTCAACAGTCGKPRAIGSQYCETHAAELDAIDNRGAGESITEAFRRSPRRVPETPAKPGRDADHCDYPDCEQHWTYVATEQRKLLSEARAYVLSFASITKHPTAQADAHDLIRRMDGWVKNSPPIAAIEPPADAGTPRATEESSRRAGTPENATPGATGSGAVTCRPASDLETPAEPVSRVDWVLDVKVTVCSECLCASCWQGIFYCDRHKEASTTQKTVGQLRALGPLESPEHWFRSPHTGVVSEMDLSAYQSAVKARATQEPQS